ncbi:hypothetical protein FOCG_07312 [Fusarium oxysporum f. sp. radicis-lycopersici 26381]|nr:hypothetical protein FOCG_07312 [Fusarium oxysporum f. sp. radicis-lycopersici 26381]
MRLLRQNDNGDIHLTRDYLGDDIPTYAILSHTWGDDEVTFKDITDGTGRHKRGYEKIRFCARQASQDGLQYFWVDTCCIDKSNSTELQEAINCMFRWYKNSVKCYVYLADVSLLEAHAKVGFSEAQWMPAFRNSRWFTRGWTLQELIAPASVEFFSSQGTKLGNKRSLENLIREATGLPSAALRGRPLSNFSVAQRLSWSSERNTTRPEDKAYSLLGIFDVHMPMIYGESIENALRRLHEEIGKNSENQIRVPTTRQPRCYDCGEYGHYSNEHCYECKEYGHYAKDHCPKCGELGHGPDEVHCYKCTVPYILNL